jgi:hypothetical protein
MLIGWICLKAELTANAPAAGRHKSNAVAHCDLKSRAARIGNVPNRRGTRPAAYANPEHILPRAYTLGRERRGLHVFGQCTRRAIRTGAPGAYQVRQITKSRTSLLAFLSAREARSRWADRAPCAPAPGFHRDDQTAPGNAFECRIRVPAAAQQITPLRRMQLRGPCVA